MDDAVRLDHIGLLNLGTPALLIDECELVAIDLDRQNLALDRLQVGVCATRFGLPTPLASLSTIVLKRY